jgi:hypothetical protein
MSDIDLLKFFEDHKGALAACSLFFVLSVYLHNDLIPGKEAYPYYDYLKQLPLVSFVLFLFVGISLFRDLQVVPNKSGIMNYFMYVFILFILGLSLFFLELYSEVFLAMYAIIVIVGIPIVTASLISDYISDKKNWGLTFICSIPLLLAMVGISVFNFIVNYANDQHWEQYIVGVVIGLSFALLLISFIAFMNIVSWILDKAFGHGQKFWANLFKSKT